ncbi:hypothetical protein [Rhodobacter sp. SY28-1]|uniref:hypothetical protein n=1 Tax=Rhodobacter sp. SY28-1 TaxID=2562317 RepID=UPI0010C12910|nr:hypothetical protein [Rhodobacter sp. SY28-1]
MHRPLLAVAIAASLIAPAQANDSVQGQETLYTSPNGVTERCVRITPMPGAVYSDEDLAAEAEFCAIDLYAPTVALCPKTWSTSPGMIVHDISTGPYAGDRKAFETRACPEGKEAKGLGGGEMAKFKPTMNARGTSGTFSASPLLYYHLSRFFGADIGVPPAVWRSMDREMHLTEVARPGVAISGHSHSSDMNRTGWQVLVEADQKPDSYSPTDDLFTADRTALYGVMLRAKGSRYNSELNGTRASGWGEGQNYDFQGTAPFLALRSQKPLAEAVAEGVAEALKDPQIRRDMAESVDPRQIVSWMTDLTNIALLDFILSQQDRVGNIDYVEHWYWIENGALKSRKAVAHGDETEPLPEGAVKLKRTHLNDNDAGARLEYANFAKSTGMLDDLHHFPAATWRQLMALEADLKAEGPLHAYLKSSFGLSERQFAQLVKNTLLAAATLRMQCQAGAIQFDLDPETFILTGTATPETVDCGAP